MEQKKLRELRSEIGDHLSEADELSVKYLTACGWRHTSNTPGCFWMWTRSVPPEIAKDLPFMACNNTAEALRFQDRLTAERWPLAEDA